MHETFGTGVDCMYIYSAELYVTDQISHCRNHRESINSTFTLQIIDTVKIKKPAEGEIECDFWNPTSYYKDYYMWALPRKNARWTWLTWTTWSGLLRGLFMLVVTDCAWLNERTDLNNVVGTIMINNHIHTSYRTCCHAGDNEITRLRSDITTTMNLVVVSSRVFHVLTYTNNPCRFTKLFSIICWNMIEQYRYFSTHLNSLVIQSCWANKPVIACDNFTRTCIPRL